MCNFFVTFLYDLENRSDFNRDFKYIYKEIYIRKVRDMYTAYNFQFEVKNLTSFFEPWIYQPYLQADVCQHGEFLEIDPNHKMPQVILFYGIECHLYFLKMTCMNQDLHL